MLKRVLSVIIKKKSILVVNNDDIEAICIDDFAKKKRKSYGTIMVNLADGRVIDLIESSEKEDVVIWISLFPNIKYVSRDGSLTYAAVIREVHPEAHHIGDRFNCAVHRHRFHFSETRAYLFIHKVFHFHLERVLFLRHLLFLALYLLIVNNH